LKWKQENVNGVGKKHPLKFLCNLADTVALLVQRQVVSANVKKNALRAETQKTDGEAESRKVEA